MIRSLFAVAILTALCCCVPNPVLAEDDSGFDAELAASLGADDYGMRSYVMAFLKAGPNGPDDPERLAALQQGHMNHIRMLAEEGRLVLAGPFTDGGDLRGIFVFATEDLDQARAWTEADPAVQAGSLVMELRPWYGSAALQQINQLHGQIARSHP